MKNFFILFSALFIFFLSATTYFVGAQPTTPSPQNILSGISNCGGVDQACCDLNQPTNINLGIQGLPFPLDVVVAPVNIGINFIAGSIIGAVDGIKNLFVSGLDINGGYCKEGTTPSDANSPNCTCLDTRVEAISRLCLMTSNTTEQSNCLSCVTGKKGIWTAVGCIESDLSSFIRDTLLGWGIGLAGVFALLCIIYSAFQMQTSQGNPERIKKAQEMLTSCITGLVLIIFSVFILRLIGVSILRIPGFQ